MNNTVWNLLAMQLAITIVAVGAAWLHLYDLRRKPTFPRWLAYPAFRYETNHAAAARAIQNSEKIAVRDRQPCRFLSKNPAFEPREALPATTRTHLSRRCPLRLRPGSA